MAGVNLTTKELDNIFKTYENYGAEKLSEFIQAIWFEAFAEGREQGYKQGLQLVIGDRR
jgi:hypothetical protein